MRIIWQIAGNKFKKMKIFYNNKQIFQSQPWLSSISISSHLPKLKIYERTENIVKNRIINARLWYEEFTGIDEVRAAQNRVLEAENKFISSQDTRRSTNNKLSQIQNKLREIYSELDKTKRGEERYVFLITQEHAILKEEQALEEEFQKYEREERERFTILSSALKDSHEKERLQAERTKYWSIIGSIFGTIIGIIGSSISNEFRMRELRTLLSDVPRDFPDYPKIEKIMQQWQSQQQVPSAKEITNGTEIQLLESVIKLHDQQAVQQKLILGVVTVFASVIMLFCYITNS